MSAIVPEKPRWCWAMPIERVGATMASWRSPAPWATSSGQSASVPTKPVGPCCSVEPIGMTMPRERVR